MITTSSLWRRLLCAACLLLALAAFAQAQTSVAPYPRFKGLDPNTGAFLVGGKLYTYLCGTSTPKATYTAQDGLFENTNPVQLDGSGEADVWLGSGCYKFVLADAYDVVIWTVDNINGPAPGNFSVVTVSSTLTVSGASSLQAVTLSTLSASGQITSTVVTGTKPFVVSSATKNDNLNCDLLDGGDFAAPGPIGSTTPSTGAFTTLSASGNSTIGGTLGVTGNVTGSANTISQSANGAQWIRGQISEEITLNTGSTTTDSTADLLPANSIIEGVTARVTATIATASDWKLGDSAQAARFLAATTDLTLGTTKVGLAHAQPTVASNDLGPVQTANSKLRISTTGTPSAGKIRVTVYFRQFIAPTS